MARTASVDPALVDTESGARGAIYGLLAGLFEEPDRETYEALAAGEVGDQFDSWVDTAGFEALEVPDLETTDEYDLLCARFNDIFAIGYPDPPVPLYESAYATEGQWESINLDLARAYDYFGVSIDESEREHHDHLVVELEFVGYLARLAATEGRSDLKQARVDFLERHLVDLAEHLEEGIADEVETGIYEDLVAFLAAFVRADRDALTAETSDAEVTPP